MSQKPRRIKLGIPSAELHGGLHMCRIDEQAHERLRKAFVSVIHLLCERSSGTAHEHEKQLFPVGYVLTELGLFDPDVPDKLRALWQAIDDAVSNAYSNGEEEGASLLKQLAAGKATIDEYNDITIGKE
jgi:hypothetical protein